MGSLSKLIQEKGGELGYVKAGQAKVQQIHYTKLKESDLNFYTRSREEVEELADTMLVAGGILQPLIVRKTDISEYEILAGHKRRRASICNIERGYKEFEFLPCIVIDMSGLLAKKISEKILAENGDIDNDKLLDMIAEYIVICTNSTTREKSSYEKMMQAVRLSKILPVMLADEGLKGRALRSEIAKEMKYGDGQVGRYLSIYNNLVPEAMELFKKDKMHFSIACALAGLEQDKQYQVLQKQQITKADIEAFKQERSKENESCQGSMKVVNTGALQQKEDGKTVSNMDTANTSQLTSEPLPDDGYEMTVQTEEGVCYALQLIFDDESGFPEDVQKELISFMEEMGVHVSVMTDIFDKALPFENSHIKIERNCGYIIYYKDTHRKMRVALWPFWKTFRNKYHYHEKKSLSDENEMNGSAMQDTCSKTQDTSAAVMDKKTAASVETEPECSRGYTLEDVRKIYEEQIKRMQELKREKKFNNLTPMEEKQYKEARIIRDGMTYILEAFRDGSIC